MLLSLLVLGGAIAFFRITRRINDESIRIIGIVLGVIGLIVSLALAPWVLKLVMVVLLLTMPNCVRGNGKPSNVCPKFCVARGRCHTLKFDCFGWVRSPHHHRPEENRPEQTSHSDSS